MTDAKRDTNYVTTLSAVSSVDGVSIVPLRADPVTGRLLVSLSSGVTFYADTVSGTINGSNTAFTVANTISSALVLYLANSAYQPVVDFTVSATNITMAVAPDASLSGQPFWLLHT